MADIEMVKPGLRCCKDINKTECHSCPYDYNGRSDRHECTADLANGALTVIEELQAEIEWLEKENGTLKLAVQSMPNWLDEKRPEVVRCKDCRYGQYCTDGETTYQCFKWNSNEFGALHEQDWFCADGKRKDGDGE